MFDILGRGSRIKEPLLHTAGELVEELADNIVEAIGAIDGTRDDHCFESAAGPVKIVLCGHGLGAIGIIALVILLLVRITLQRFSGSGSRKTP